MATTLQNPALKRLIITCAICFVAVGGVWVATFKHTSAAPVASSSASRQGVDANGNIDTKLNDPAKIFTVTVKDGKKVSGPGTIRVKNGDSVRINIKALGNDEAQVSLPDFGVDTESAPSDNTPGGLLFVADKVGTFKYYLLDEHDASKKTDIGTLVVN